MSPQRITEATLSDALAAAAYGVMSSRERLNHISVGIAANFPGSTGADAPDAGRSFYRFDEASMELRMALSMEKAGDDSLIVKAAYLNADYCNEYDYDPGAASAIRVSMSPAEPGQEIKDEINRIKEVRQKKNFDAIRLYKGTGEAPSIIQFKSAGLNHVMDENLQAYLDAVAATTGLFDVAKLQELMDRVNAFQIIKGRGGSQEAPAISMDDLTSAGLKNILEANLGLYQKKISETTISDFTQAQNIVHESNFQAVRMAPEISDLNRLKILGLDNFIEPLVTAYQLSMGVSNFSTIEELRGLFHRANLGAIRDYSLKGDSPEATAGQITAVGIQRVVDENIAFYNEIMRRLSVRYLPDWDNRVKNAATAYRDSVVRADFFTNIQPLQDVIDAVNMDVIRKHSEPMTIKRLQAMGMEKETLIQGNLENYRLGVEKNSDALSVRSDVQILINRENRLADMRGYRFAGDMTPVSAQWLSGMGLNHVKEAHLEYYKSVILTSGSGFPASFEAAQGLIHRVNAEHGDLTGLKASGADGIRDEKFALYSAAVSGSNSAGRSLALQAIVDMENAISAIRDYCLSGNASPLSIKQIKETGVDQFMEANFQHYRTGIASADSIPGISELQGVVDYINAIVEKTVGINELKNAGIGNGVEANLGKYKDAGFTPNIGDMKKRADLVNFQVIQASALAKDAQGISIEQLQAVRTADGLSLNIIEENLMWHRSGIAAAGIIPDVGTLENIIDGQNALAVIQSFRLTGDARELTLAQLNASGVKNLDNAYLTAYQRAIEESVSIVNRHGLQALINEVNEA